MHSSRSRPCISACAIAIFIAAGSISALAADYVRVNQIGYEAGHPARAYLMTAKAITGASFALVNSSGQTVLSGAVGSTLGLWGKFDVYPIDFTLHKHDTYTISVSKGVKGVSPAFRVDTPENLYSAPLANNLYFYENERDGANFIPTPLRTAAGHLNDAKAAVYSSPSFDDDDNIIGSLAPTGATINAEGGWWDAGDYLKFVQTESYVVAMMLVGVRDFPEQMGTVAQSDFTGEARFGIDWLQKMWDDWSRTLYYQVGIGTDFESFDYLSDHDIWRLPQGTTLTWERSDLSVHTPPSGVCGGAGGVEDQSESCGASSGEFRRVLLRCLQETNPALAKQCLLEAEHVFDLADTAPTGNLLTTAPYDFYPESEWRDDLELGATELYFALRRESAIMPQDLPHADPMHY